MAPPTFVARPVAPEDIRPGAYIAVLTIVIEAILPESADCADRLSFVKRRFVLLPWDQAGPMKVLSVCLPFVLVRTTKGAVQTLDARRFTFASLPKEYAKDACARLRRPTVTSDLC